MINVEQNSDKKEANNLDLLSLGQILKKKRVESKIEISKASSYLKVRVSDIEAIENDKIDDLAKYLYVTGLIRSYAKFIGLTKEILDKKLKSCLVQSNVENKNHELVNIGENIDLSPERSSVFEFLVISIVLFIVLLTIYNFSEDRDDLISSKNIINELNIIDE